VLVVSAQVIVGHYDWRETMSMIMMVNPSWAGWRGPGKRDSDAGVALYGGRSMSRFLRLGLGPFGNNNKETLMGATVWKRTRYVGERAGM